MRARLVEIVGGMLVGLALLGASAGATLLVGRLVGMPGRGSGRAVAVGEALR